jgi:hypothetical protein
MFPLSKAIRIAQHLGNRQSIFVEGEINLGNDLILWLQNPQTRREHNIGRRNACIIALCSAEHVSWDAQDSKTHIWDQVLDSWRNEINSANNLLSTMNSKDNSFTRLTRFIDHQDEWKLLLLIHNFHKLTENTHREFVSEFRTLSESKVTYMAYTDKSEIPDGVRHHKKIPFNKDNNLQSKENMQVSTEPRPVVFISHAKEDSKKALQLEAALGVFGIDAWVDKVDIQPGDQWEIEITEAIKKADFAIPCFSKQSVNKIGFIQAEYRLIEKMHKMRPPRARYAFPVRFDNCVVSEFEMANESQRTDLFPQSKWSSNLEKLAQSILDAYKKLKK